MGMMLRRHREVEEMETQVEKPESSSIVEPISEEKTVAEPPKKRGRKKATE